ncbi:MAG TPA: hypothetical protein VGI89_08375, partial [Rhizomicrobium sp.]
GAAGETKNMAQLRMRMGADVPVVGPAAIGQSLQMKIMVANGLRRLSKKKEIWDINILIGFSQHLGGPLQWSE